MSSSLGKIIFGIFISFLRNGGGKIYEPCELGLELLYQGIEIDRLGDWICLANAASRYNTSLIGGLNFYNPNKSYQFGIFQIGNRYWCLDEHWPESGDCGQKCDDFLNKNITDDIKCAKLIYQTFQNTFAGWASVYNKKCGSSDDGNQMYLADCNFEYAVKPAIYSDDGTSSVTLQRNKLYLGQTIVECVANGTQPIQIKWLKNSQILEKTDETFGLTFGQDETGTLTLSNITLHRVNLSPSDDVTLFTCEAQNQYGSDSQNYLVKVLDAPIAPENSTLPPSSGFTDTKQMVIAIVVTAVITVVGISIYKYFLTKNTGLNYEEINAFYNGDVTHILIGVENDGYIESLLAEPYDKNFEVKRRDLEIDKKEPLGLGQFGVVYKGFYKKTVVAIKTLKPGADKTYLKAILSELKVLIYVKGHGNVVEIFGAYTKELKRGLVYLIMEYCPMGSLMKYLQKNRPDSNVYTTSHRGSLPRSKEVEIVSGKGEQEIIDLQEMLRWSYQISSAMDYLSSKKVIHGDLATRNILLANLHTVKITDFGLSRKLYDYAIYVKEEDQQAPLPWRWMSPETLRELKFSTRSDVWSYGVTLWEIFSFAQVPYTGRLGWSNEFLREVEGGLRPEQPTKATDSIYTIMKNCWKIDPEERPSFPLIRHSIYLELKKLSNQEYFEIEDVIGCT